MQFHLYRLAFLAIEQVVKHLDPREIYNLSKCSKRSFRIINSLVKNQKCSLDLRVGKTLKLDVHHNCGMEFQYCHLSKLEDMPGTFNQHFSSPEDVFGRSISLSYWENPYEAFKEFYNHMRCLYEKPINHLIYVVKPGAMCYDLLEQINQNQPFIERATVTFMKTVEEEMVTALNMLSAVRNMTWGPFIIRDGQFRNVIQKFEYDNLTIGAGGVWLGIKHILNMDCRTIRIACQHTLNQAHLTEYLKAWITGAAPKLEHFILIFENLNLSIVLREIEFQKVDTNDTFTETKGPYIIQRKHDGRRAKVFGAISKGWHCTTYYDSFEISVLE
uniref:F-box domain-containing protein n=1 Tax=Caenorhabditis tropicalis TaxID=1561998 RepID=A0A1I7TLN0_9PELO